MTGSINILNANSMRLLATTDRDEKTQARTRLLNETVIKLLELRYPSFKSDLAKLGDRCEKFNFETGKMDDASEALLKKLNGQLESWAADVRNADDPTLNMSSKDVAQFLIEQKNDKNLVKRFGGAQALENTISEIKALKESNITLWYIVFGACN